MTRRNASDDARGNDSIRMNATNVMSEMNESCETNAMSDGMNENLSVGLSGAF